MTTSANILHGVLEAAAVQTPADTITLVDAIGQTLGYGQGQDVKIYNFTSRLVAQMDADLAQALTVQERNHAAGFSKDFRVLHNMDTYVTPVKDLGGEHQILSDASLSGLLTAGLILSGKMDRSKIEKNPDYVMKMEALTDRLRGLDVPEDSKDVMLERMNQVEKAVDSFHIFGEKPVEEALEKLVGSIDLHTPTQMKKGFKGRALYRDVTAAVGYVTDMAGGDGTTAGAALKGVLRAK